MLMLEYSLMLGCWCLSVAPVQRCDRFPYFRRSFFPSNPRACRRAVPESRCVSSGRGWRIAMSMRAELLSACRMTVGAAATVGSRGSERILMREHMLPVACRGGRSRFATKHSRCSLSRKDATGCGRAPLQGKRLVGEAMGATASGGIPQTLPR